MPENTNNMKNKTQAIHCADIDIALNMLTTYMDARDIQPLITALETLKSDTNSEDYQSQVIEAFNKLGVLQGAALTYAPYLNIFVSDDPFGD